MVSYVFSSFEKTEAGLIHQTFRASGFATPTQSCYIGVSNKHEMPFFLEIFSE